MSSSSPRVAYICSQVLAQTSSLLPSNRNRSALVHTLVSAYGLLKRETCTLIKPQRASRRDLERYHEAGYLDYVLQPHDEEEIEEYELRMEKQEISSGFGLEDDCPVFPRIDEYIYLVAGATLTAVQAIQSGRFEVAICWDGGRHHAHKAHAAGFCYVADCVLCILQLKRAVPGQKERPRVMYLDLDLHHGDGVAEAFTSRPVDELEVETIRNESGEQNKDLSPSNVLTLSIHHHARGFYPHAALGSLTTSSTSDPFSLSIPLARGTSAPTYARIWNLVERVASAFFVWEGSANSSQIPSYLIVQCGVDGLAGDPYATWNWDIDVERDGSLGWCIQRVIGWVKNAGLKVVFLGGGGYNNPNAARAWAYLTSIVTGNPLSIAADIPDHGGFLQYAPSFTIDVSAGNMPDENTEQELVRIENVFNVLVGQIQHAQSRVQ